MVATHSGTDVVQQLLSLIDRDASQEDPCGAPMIEALVDDHVGLSTPHRALVLSAGTVPWMRNSGKTDLQSGSGVLLVVGSSLTSIASAPEGGLPGSRSVATLGAASASVGGGSGSVVASSSLLGCSQGSASSPVPLG